MSGLLGDSRAMIPLQQQQQIQMAQQQRKKEERIPQWAFHETKEFIAIRAEFEKDFTQTKRNKMLWELIAGRMKEKGFRRSADQCKCKWKNLVNRYKGKEISEPDNGRQCPFYEELDAVFKERSKNMDRLLLESDGSSLQHKKRLKPAGLLSDEESDDELDNEDDDENNSDEDLKQQQIQQQPIQHPAIQIQHPPIQIQQQQQQQQRSGKKRKSDKERQRSTAERSRAGSMQEVLEDFLQQQQRLEEQWRQAVERREVERRGREAEWRMSMEKLEQERAVREQVWWEREEQRRVRDELRSRKRDELVEAVLRKVIRDD